MINFKITPNLDGLTIVKPSGEAIPLKIGEIIKAEVMDLLPSGGVALKIKGDTIVARTEVPLQKDATVFFKVVNTPSAGQDLRLQFLGVEEQLPGTASDNAPGKAGTLPSLLQELASGLVKGGGETASTLDSIFKALPSDMNSLPGDIKLQLQNLLQASLKATGQSLKGRIEDLITRQLPPGLEDHPVLQDLKNELLVHIDKMLGAPLQDSLENSGVVLEAKLKSAFEQEALQKEGAGPAAKGQAGDTTDIRRDLKAGLLQLKELLTETSGPAAKDIQAKSLAGTAGEAGTLTQESAVKNLASQIDGLLKDIGTFQLLSKTSDSFCTFLPVRWKELKDGEIEFKKGNKDPEGNNSCSCRIQLDLEEFGSLSIMVLMHNKQFYVSFKAGRPDFQLVLTSRLDELKDAFREQGLPLGSVNVLNRNSTAMEQFEKTDAVNKIVNIKA